MKKVVILKIVSIALGTFSRTYVEAASVFYILYFTFIIAIKVYWDKERVAENMSEMVWGTAINYLFEEN